MKCFYHPEKDALGICHYCYKGLCEDCLTDLEFGLACKGKHEEDVIAINRLIKYNSHIQQRFSRGKGQWFFSAFYILMGSIFIFYGFQSDGLFYFVTVLGACFILAGVGWYVYQKILNKKFRREYEK